MLARLGAIGCAIRTASTRIMSPLTHNSSFHSISGHPPRTHLSPLSLMSRFEKLPVEKLDGTPTGKSVPLDPMIFSLPIRQDLLHQVVVWQLAKRRAGTACTKTRAEVAGSNRKLYQQKGTGKARAGDKKAGHRRGGGRTLGPKPRDYEFKLNKKVKSLALRTALSTKLAQKQIVLVDSLDVPHPDTPVAKTSKLVELLAERKWNSALVLDSTVNADFKHASRNLKHIQHIAVEGGNVYDILKRDFLVLTTTALAQLTSTLASKI
eukprot:c4414_g1_i1.p1 GENE.c4414_g1_i1~~c4414_g1_i1.p1  ORF type:complete len:265 (-),score=64.70 c4414_g1_i1:231-1025(-)